MGVILDAAGRPMQPAPADGTPPDPYIFSPVS